MDLKNMIVVKDRMAGFGSNFLQAIDWLWYSKNAGVPVYVEWTVKENNIFDIFFIQNHKKESPFTIVNKYYNTSDFSNEEIDKIRFIDIPMYKKYNRFLFCDSHIYHEKDFNQLRLFFNKIYNDNLKFRNQYTSFIKPNTLGVHIRFIKHFFTDVGPSNPLKNICPESEFYFKNLNQIRIKFEIGNYKNIYLGCDDIKFFDICKSEFKDKLIYQSCVRSEGDWWNKKTSLLPEFNNALVDIFNLSNCDNLIGCVSNFTFTVLLLNPYSNFELFDTMKYCYTA
jgi:hypothetical protein